MPAGSVVTLLNVTPLGRALRPVPINLVDYIGTFRLRPGDILLHLPELFG
jgi:hypothetical protein